MRNLDVREWHSKYEDDRSTVEGVPLKDIIDDVFNDIQGSLKAHAVLPANDDRAEELVAALYRYVIVSGEAQS